MTIQQALERLDSLQHNTYSDSDKLLWLSRLEARVRQELLGEHAPFSGYGADTDRGTVLLLDAPYEELYLLYLQAQIHYHDEEFERCNNAMALFQTLWDSCRNHHNRSCPPRGEKLRYF